MTSSQAMKAASAVAAPVIGMGNSLRAMALGAIGINAPNISAAALPGLDLSRLGMLSGGAGSAGLSAASPDMTAGLRMSVPPAGGAHDGSIFGAMKQAAGMSGGSAAAVSGVDGEAIERSCKAKAKWRVAYAQPASVDADFLICLMDMHRSRLCEPKHRTQMVEQIRAFILKRDESLSLYAGLTEVGLARNASKGADKLPTPQDWEKATEAAYAKAKDLFRFGYLIKSDFGWFPPGTLSAVFAAGEQARFRHCKKIA